MISMNPLNVPLIIEVAVRGGPVIGWSGKSSLYCPFTLNQSASLIGVAGLMKEIPLSVARLFPLMFSGGLFRNT